MNTLYKTLSVALLSCGVAVSAFAATTPVQPQPARHTTEQRAERIAKIQAENTALFQQADANKDGKLSEPEFSKFNELKKAAWQARKQEFEKNRFARLDTNKDGALSQDELKAAHAQRASFRHHHHNAQQAAQKPTV